MNVPQALDNETLIAKFTATNASFIVTDMLAREFREPRYSELRNELCGIDAEIRRRGLYRTPQHKAAVKAAHDRAWQLFKTARPSAVDHPSDYASAAPDRPTHQLLPTILAPWRSIFAFGHRSRG